MDAPKFTRNTEETSEVPGNLNPRKFLIYILVAGCCCPVALIFAWLDKDLTLKEKVKATGWTLLIMVVLMIFGAYAPHK